MILKVVLKSSTASEYICLPPFIIIKILNIVEMFLSQFDSFQEAEGSWHYVHAAGEDTDQP